MKRYVIGLALTGLGTRLAKRVKGIVPQGRQASLPVNIAGMVIAAGIGAGLARWLSRR
ncbi:MAG TPA: hypothetical protein VKA60_21900 [Blastocatellia bacterium]|nr:hypothetical protein [Blastocatellia bacterium]